MTPERWKQVEELFQAALDLPSDERPGFIAQVGAGDEALRKQVEALVAQYEEAGDFIEAPAFAVNGFNPGSAPFRTTQPTDSEDDPMAGARVGAYRIVREIGRGGMGAVYLAVRADSEYQKRVAIKLVKRGMDTDFILRRFRNERQILASLDHTNIARLLDGGTTETGLPYFVMEYIEGQPLYRYCDGEKLTIHERLRLFVQLCNAVAYAHQNLVVHRDIKPSNILICADGTPKLLDFGIAKLLNPELSPDTLTPTATAMRLMTPEYASPEQVRGEAATPASDIYSMGVLLYELLTGHRPYHFPNRSPHEIARVICEEEPEHPSRVVTRPEDMIPLDGMSGEMATTTLETMCKLRGTTIESLRRELAGDLDNITLKALRKEPGRRYTSVERLRDDIARHLEGRPVSAPFAFPTSAKTSRVSTGDNAVTGERTLAVLPFKLLNIQRTEETGENYLGIGLADALITRLSNVRRFSVRPTSSVIRYSGGDIGDPFAAGHELGVSYVVDGRIQRAGDRIRITVQLLNVYDGATMWAGQFDENYTDVLSLEDAISTQVAGALVPQLTGDEREQLAKRGTDNAEAFEVYLRGRYHWNTFNEEGFAKAITCYYRAIALDPDYAAAYTGIADYYNWIGIYGVMPPAECSAAAKEAGARALELDETLPDAHTAYGFAVHTHDLDWETPIAHYRRALELNPHHAATHLWHGTQLVMEGNFDTGLPLVRRALELDPLTLFNQHMLGFCLFYARRYEESLALYREMVETASMHGLGYFGFSWVLGHLGRHEEAINAAIKAIEFSGPSPFITATLGSAYATAGRAEEARRVLSELEELAAKRYVSPYYLAIVYTQLGNHERAFALLEQSFADREAWIVWLGVQPQFDRLRSDPRFAELVRRTKNPGLARLGGSLRPAQGALPGQSNSAENARKAELYLSENEEARQLYTAGHYFSTRRTADGLRQAIRRFERAVELDPGFAIAYAELADCYALLNWYVEPPPADAFERAKRAAVKAVAADPNLAEAHASLGYIKLHYERDWAGAEAEFRRAIELRPGNALAHRWYSFNLSAVGRHDEAIAEIKRAQQISPESPVIATAVANVFFLARRFDEAVAQCRRALELDAGSVAAHVILRWSYEHMGMRDEALSAYEQESVFAGDTPTTRLKEAHVLAACGRNDEAAGVLRELLARRAEQWVTPYEIAVIYSLLNDLDNAFHWLAEAEREHVVGFTFAAVDPHLDNLHNDPRFVEMLRRTKNPLAARYESEAATRLARNFDPHLSSLPTLELPVGANNNGKRAIKQTAKADVAAPQRRLSWRVAVAALFVVVALVGATAFFYVRRSGNTGAATAITANPLRLTTEIAHEWHPDFSPDGTRIAFASNRDGATEIYVMQADGSGMRRLTFNTTEDDCPTWSHDGQKIAFQSRRDGQMEVYVMDADGSNQRNLTNSPAEDTRPAWSPDDQRIAYGSNTLDAPTNYDIFTMRADGSDKIKLTDSTSFDNDATWSPDGQKIAFTSARDGKSYEIYVMNAADGSNARNLTNHPGDDAKPAWSPDGKHITFAGNRPNKTDFPAVYVMDANGNDQRLITAARTFDDEPAWSADGRRIAFQTQRDGNFDIYLADAFPEVPAATAGDKKMRSLAVLPFSTVGAQGDDQYLGVGIADELTNKLGELDEITLRTSGAVRRYLGSNKSAIEAGRELKVDYVLGGWVERVGDRVQTALELTQVEGGRVLWAERFNERFTDISTLQTSISERVVRALSLQLTGDERERLAKHYTENSEAQQLYLAGRYHWGKRTPEGLRQAIANFEQAIAKDSQFALAYAGLADCYALQNWYLEPPPPDAFARAKQAAERAVALDDSLAEAHVSLANAKFHYDRDWQGAAAEFRRAISLNPNYPTAHHWYAFNLSAMERHDDALAEIKRAEELDPRSAVIATAVANVLFHARRFDEAIEQCRKALAMDPGSLPAHIVLRWNYEKKGMTDEAFRIYEKERAFAGDTPTTRAKLAHVLAVSGRTDESRRILQELVARRKQQWVTAYEIAVVYSLLGDHDNAFIWLDRAEKEHAVGYTYLRVDPRLDNLRGDPRYAKLLR